MSLTASGRRTRSRPICSGPSVVRPLRANLHASVRQDVPSRRDSRARSRNVLGPQLCRCEDNSSRRGRFNRLPRIRHRHCVLRVLINRGRQAVCVMRIRQSSDRRHRGRGGPMVLVLRRKRDTRTNCVRRQSANALVSQEQNIQRSRIRGHDRRASDNTAVRQRIHVVRDKWVRRVGNSRTRSAKDCPSCQARRASAQGLFQEHVTRNSHANRTLYQRVTGRNRRSAYRGEGG